MTILEFIRKNSLLVIIVIAAVGAGLVMMDYSGKGSAFSRDFYIRVNNTSYDYPETANMGENGKQFLSSLYSATRDLIEPLAEENASSSEEQKQEAFIEWQRQHPDVVESLNMLNEVYAGWHYGGTRDDAVNVAINRAMLHAEADAWGLHPSEEQIDLFLRSLPAFRTEDGAFNTELYRRLAGYRHGHSNRVQEEAFRAVVADIIVWENLRAMLGKGVSFQTGAQTAMLNAFEQSVTGRTAWLPAEKVGTPPDPGEEELKAYWEEHRNQYMSDERRIVSVYTLSPAADSNMENLLSSADMLMQDLSLANGRGLDKLLADAQDNPEYDAFTYQAEDGSTHVTYPLSTEEELEKQLQDRVNYEGKEVPLAQVAFAEIEQAPTPQAYEEAQAAGNAEKELSIRQIRGFYNAADGKLKLLRIEAVERPTPLPYEQAREKALADFRREREANALQIAAEKIYKDMQEALTTQGLQSALAIAQKAGALVEDFGPVQLFRPTSVLPSGVSDADIMGTPSGKMTPLVVQPTGARFTCITGRTVEDSPSITMQKRLFELPRLNAQLRHSMMQEWQNAAYNRFDVQLAPTIRTMEKED